MLNILIHFESLCFDMNPITLLMIGSAMTLLGVFIWLVGIHYSTVIITGLGVSLGILLGILISQLTGWNIVVCILVSMIALTVIAISKKTLAGTILLAIPFMLGGGIGYASYYFHKTPFSQEYISIAGFSNERTIADSILVSQDAENSSIWVQCKELVSNVWTELGSERWMFVFSSFLGGFIGLVAILCSGRLIMLYYSVIGAAMVTFGIILLLYAKDIEVMSSLHDHCKVMLIVFTVKVLLGSAIQKLTLPYLTRNAKMAT